MTKEIKLLEEVYTPTLLDKMYSLGSNLHLGRLSIKHEPAGKERVFAITDSITQSVMAPLSDGIFSILKNIPMDGTFNQTQPLDRLISLYKDGQLKGEKFFSYDLTAATDRLPLSLQRDVMSLIISEDMALKWSQLMTDRE